MVFVKVVKTNSYFKRYQTKPRRRRQNKTDYQARRSMIQQDKNKYEAKKYRFVVRKTNQKILCQIVTAHPQGDRIEYQAESTELKKFGLTAGLTNYAAAYATGLLLARRLLKSKGMETMYQGISGKDIDGDYFDIYKDDGALIDQERRPFKCILDIGIYRATTGNKVFGALKGFTDGGVHVKHNNRRFPGFKVILPTEKGDKVKETYDPAVHKAKIFGTEINNYLNTFDNAKAERNKQQFTQWRKCITANKVKSLDELYAKVHEAIRKNPERATADVQKARAEKQKKAVRKTVDAKKGIYTDSKNRKWIRYQKLSKVERDANVQTKLASIIAAAAERRQ